MKMGDVVRRLDIGSSVAEFDEALDKYFVDTEPFRAVILGKADIIAGDKGTGKTAIFRILQKRRGSISELKDVEILPAFNPSGNPIFQRLVQEAALTEQRYISIWKTYIFALVGNWLLEIFEPDSSDSPRGALDRLLRQTNLRSKDDAPATVFSRLMNLFHWWPRPKSAEVQLTVSDAGMPVVTPKVEFADQEASGKTTGRGTADSTGLVRHEDAFQLLNQCLKECGVSVWIALDRLDEAFQGCPDVETPALRALLRTYLDLLEFDCIRLKLFVRRDLFRKVVKGGFVNLTHINARKIEIIWDKDDLLNLLCQRFRESGDLLKILGVENESNDEVFRRIFPDQIDVGDRKPTSWNWIMSRIRDGNDVRPPRNLIDLVTKAREAQLRREDRDPREFMEGLAIVEADSIRRGLGHLSSARVEDTLIAEAGEEGTKIEKFRKGKSEYDEDTLCAVLGVSKDDLASEIKPLLEIGFLERIEASYKVPMLYRDGLEITQGKAT